MSNSHISYLYFALIILFPLFTEIVECRLSSEKLSTVFRTPSTNADEDEGTKWAVLVAGSNGYLNYRHQADICHAYQILKKGGLRDENIIVFMYDDIAFNDENPRKGIIINNPNGEDVYKGVPKDYTGSSVNAHNLLAVIHANRTGLKGGSAKVLNTGPNDHIFFYYSDHGSPGVLTMPNDPDSSNPEDDLYAMDLIEALKIKHARGAYKSMVIYVEACEAGSIFEGLLPENWNIYVTTASNANESSWAVYCPGFEPPPPPDFDTCLGDLFSVAWMENSDQHNLQTETLYTQFQEVKTRTAGGKEHSSHVTEYGDIDLNKDPLSFYMGKHSNYGKEIDVHGASKPVPLVGVTQHQADILYFKEKVRRAAYGSIKRAQAEKDLEATLLHRKNVDYSIEAIGKTLFGAQEASQILETVKSVGQPLVDDWECLKTMVGIYKRHCGASSSYWKKHTRAFANMCNVGVRQEQATEAILSACGNNMSN